MIIDGKKEAELLRHEVKKEIDRTSMKSTAAARNAAYMPVRSVHEGSNNV